MISVKNLHKSFNGLEVLKGINTEIEKGDVVCIIGPSGSGKSTFLRCLNLLETPDSGSVILDGTELTDKKTNINKERMKMIPKLVEEFKVDGIVEVDLQACTPYCVETFRVKQLADSMNIPYLAVETDYSQSDSGQLSTRMEAFLEMHLNLLVLNSE